MRLVLIKHWLGQLDYKIGSSKVVVVFTEYSGRFWVGLCCPILQIWTPFESDFALKIINLVLDNICGYIDLSCVRFQILIKNHNRVGWHIPTISTQWSLPLPHVSNDSQEA